MNDIVEKMVTVPVHVEDVTGVLIELKKSGFSVVNVGTDKERTYVYLDPSEEKDPAPIVQSWVGVKAPVFTDRDSWTRRSKELEALPPPPQTLVPSRPSLLSRIFRKIMG